MRKSEKGVPRSRAKDHVMRDAVVVMPTAQAQVSERTTAPMTVAPAMEPTELWKIWMKGKPVAVSRTDWTLPRQKRMVSIMLNPRRPFMHMLMKMARGMLRAACSISSAMWTLASAPTKVATFPRKPTQYESPWLDQPPSLSAVRKTDLAEPLGARARSVARMQVQLATWKTR